MDLTVKTLAGGEAGQLSLNEIGRVTMSYRF